jgi:hypothetical protein
MTLLLVGLKLTSNPLNVEMESMKFAIPDNNLRTAEAFNRVNPVSITVITSTEQYDTDYELKSSSHSSDDSYGG